jgi:hypothetical protein
MDDFGSDGPAGGEAHGATSRRRFLAGAAGAAAGAGMLGALTGTAAAGGRTSPPVSRGAHPPIDVVRRPHPHYQRGVFENATGARVVVHLAGGPVTLTIRDITPLDIAKDARAGTNEWQNAFRVDLIGPEGVRIPQGTHRITVGGRSFDLFVVPVMHYGSSPRYEAIIHRAYYRRLNG